VESGPAELPINGQLVLRFDAPVDPLSVTADAVVVSADGAPLPAEVGVEQGALVVRPIVTPELLSRPPARLELRLAAAPSLRGLRTTAGLGLERPVTIAAALVPRLQDGTGTAPRLLEVQGRPAASVAQVGSDGRVVLVFDGVLDPATVTPAACALSPVQGGLVLPSTLEPEVDWTCIGRRFELRLRLPAKSGPLQFALRRCGLRDFAGRVPEPPIVLELRPAGV
jgi:hypothetical protein